MSSVLSSPAHHLVVVEADATGMRLDKWLTTIALITSRSRAAQLIDRNLIRLNGKALKASFKVQEGQLIQIELPVPEASSLLPLNRELDILYQDDDVVVINKPSGLVVHPAAGHAQDTLVNILLHHIGQLSMGFGEGRPGIVHRLDRDTSGLLVVAKNDLAHQSLANQFRLKTAHRIYWALVHGVPKPSKGTFRTHLARHPKDRKRFASNLEGKGKLAITHFETLQTLSSGIAWLKCQLETGRTHQIRVHLQEAGHPLLGDPIYGRKSRLPMDVEVGRLALHACELGFEHPRLKTPLKFKVGWPLDLAGFANSKGFKNVST